jgi:hypothetical protein
MGKTRCPSCGHDAHPHHLCTARSGGTVYACMCSTGHLAEALHGKDDDVECSMLIWLSPLGELSD